jgi:putative peptidoglycan lipid II flippase
VGVGASQLNGFIDTLFARAAHLSGPAYLYYAMRLYQLPLAVFGIALSSALLPPLCRACQKGEKIAFINLMQFALRKSFSLMIPLSISLIALGHPLIHFVYLRGAFDIQAAMHTTECLIGYAIGLCFSVMVLILAPAFYAKKDFRTPLKGSLISIGLNIILNGLFIYVFRWRISTVAFSTSFVTFFNAFYLYQALKRQEREKLIDRKTWVASFKVTAASVAAAVSAWGCMHFFVPSPDTFLGRSIELIQQGSIFSLTFLVLAWILKIDEFFESTGLSFLVRQKESIKKL